MNSVAWRVIVLALSLSGLSAVVNAGTPPPARPDRLVAAAGDDWWRRARSAIEASEYNVSWSNATSSAPTDVGWQAPNRAHGFRVWFTEDGVRIVPRRGDAETWEWGLSLVAWGRAGSMIPVPAARLAVDRQRIDADRGALLEWFVNGPKGLEQGFKIEALPEENATVPDGAESATCRAPLQLDLALTGTLRPALSEDRQAVDFTTPGGARVLRYAGLAAQDAREPR